MDFEEYRLRGNFFYKPTFWNLFLYLLKLIYFKVLHSPCLIILKAPHHKISIWIFIKLFLSINIVAYYHGWMVKISNIWTPDHEFESAWGFCSLLLNIFFIERIFRPIASSLPIWLKYFLFNLLFIIIKLLFANLTNYFKV